MSYSVGDVDCCMDRLPDQTGAKKERPVISHGPHRRELALWRSTTYAHAPSGVPCGCRTNTRSNTPCGQRSSYRQHRVGARDGQEATLGMTSIDRRTFVKHSALAGAAVVTRPDRLAIRESGASRAEPAFDLEEATVA